MAAIDLNSVIQELIDAKIEEIARGEKPRPHMGVSMIGHPCERWMWLSFRWAVQEKFNGRMRRLFQRGHDEEAKLVKWLEMVGVDFSERQAVVNFGSHVSGSADGLAMSGVPEAEKTRHIVEFKTHSLKSFSDLSMKGVEKAKPMHYAQMQGYMHGMAFNRALYVAICKDDDRIYTERVRYDKAFAEKMVERAKRVATSDRIPPPISTDPSWYQCKFCPAHKFCHQREPTKHVNCRTCAFSTAEKDSTWTCTRHEAPDIPVEFQYEGCEDHVLHPDMVPWRMEESADPWTVIYVVGGNEVENGRSSQTVYSSREILADAHACASNETVREIRKLWPGAEVVR